MNNLPQTIKYKGKIYALECVCKERGGHSFFDRSNEVIMKFTKKTEKLRCPVCDYYPWIVLKLVK